MENKENMDVLEMLDLLYGMVTEAWGVPLGADKCIIEREKAIDIINGIKDALPTSISESKRLVQARDEFIGNAKRDAEALRKSAEESARSMIEDQEIVRQAKIVSSEMIASAEQKSNELRRAAGEYVNQIMREAQANLSAALETIKGTQKAMNSVTAPAPVAGGTPDIDLD